MFSSFYSTFTNEKTINCFCGYVPFTRQCLNSEYIRHELNEDAKNNNTLEDLSQEYEEAKVKLLEEGLNVEDILMQRLQLRPNLEEKKRNKNK